MAEKGLKKGKVKSVLYGNGGRGGQENDVVFKLNSSKKNKRWEHNFKGVAALKQSLRLISKHFYPEAASTDPFLPLIRLLAGVSDFILPFTYD